MNEKRGWGKAVLGWFVVTDDAPSAPGSAADSPADADALIRKYADAPEQDPHPVELKGPLPPMVAGEVDFNAVFEAAGVDTAERDRVQKARELLKSLPAETPQPTKKQIVEASLRAFGVPTEKIIEASVEEVQALEAFIRAGSTETQKVLSEGSARIGQLENEMAQVKKVMEQAVAEQETRTKAANNEKLRVQDVLEFFGQEAVMKVVAESSKLQGPKAER